MRTISDSLEEEVYIDVILEPEDEEKIHDQSLDPVRVLVNGQIINIWVRMATARELYGDCYEDQDE